jgi:hypothetical protein
VSESASFCSNCGSPITAAEEQVPPAPAFAMPDQVAPPAPQPVPTPPPFQPVYNPPAPQPPLYPNVPPYARPLKDKSLAMVIEIIPGLFGFLGFGWIYAGNTNRGLLWLFGFLTWTVIATIISVATVGIGIICWFPISVAGIVISAVTLNTYTKQHPELFA